MIECPDHQGSLFVGLWRTRLRLCLTHHDDVREKNTLSELYSCYVLNTVTMLVQCEGYKLYS